MFKPLDVHDAFYEIKAVLVSSHFRDCLARTFKWTLEFLSVSMEPTVGCAYTAARRVKGFRYI
uniref:Uncharacterized protein n=1 Tax=Physcomitrium patens TaxID=3218 RepID=A0A2K1IV79_PHYPA|nr:hypothetical protein PHYPA_025128 [Physcomitrium patens]